MCRDEVNEDRIQQLLCDSVSLHDDGAHQVHHVHLHLLVMAVTVEEEEEGKRQGYFISKMGPTGNWDHILLPVSWSAKHLKKKEAYLR